MKLNSFQCSPLSLALVAATGVFAWTAIGQVFGESAFRSGVERPRPFRSESWKEESKQQRLREGTTLTNQAGFFRPDGDGATFVAESGAQLGALPNLNLERVMRYLNSTDEAESIRWVVNGTVTEFNGRNFLLISRAVFKSASAPPPPERFDP